MLQEYARNVLDISVFCCNKSFYVASCKCFIKMLHMFRIYVVSVCSKCFICFQTYVVFKCFMLQVFCVLEVCSESKQGMAREPWEEARRAGGLLMGRATRLGSCGRGVLVFILVPESRPCGEREEGVKRS